MELFHVAGGPIEPGQAIRPYALGPGLRDALDLVRRALDEDAGARSALLTARGRLRQRFRSDPEMQLVVIEAVFERVRAELAPSLSSRFESAFFWPTVELAERFRARYRPAGVIHRCAGRGRSDLARCVGGGGRRRPGGPFRRRNPEGRAARRTVLDRRRAARRPGIAGARQGGRG